MQDLVVRELKRRRLLRKEYQSRNPEVVKGKTVNRVINNSFRSDEEDDAAQPESASSSRYTPRERIQVSRPQYHNTDFGLMDDDDGRAPKQFVVGLDYGTTFASVSYYAYPESEDNPRALPSDVKIIVNCKCSIVSLPENIHGIPSRLPHKRTLNTPLIHLSSSRARRRNEWEEATDPNRELVFNHSQSPRPITRSV